MEHLYADDKRLKFPAFNFQQEKFVFSRFPFLCGGGGYGSGKSTALIFRAILLSVDSEWFGDCSGTICLLGRNKLLDFKKTTLAELRFWLPNDWVKKYWDKDGILLLKNESLIHLTHLDTTEHLQNYNLAWVGIDQMEQVLQKVFTTLAHERIRRKVFTRYDLNGTQIMPEFDGKGNCLSTDPEELNAVVKYRTVFGVCNPKPGWLMDIFYENEQFKDSPDEHVRAKYNPRYKYLHIPTRENVGNLPDDYIDIQRENKTAREFARDVEGSWESWEGKVYLGCTRSVIAKNNIVPHPSWDLYIGLDHGGSGEDKTRRTNVKAAVFIAYQHRKGQHPQIYIFDELYESGVTIEQFVTQLDIKLKRIYIAQTEFYPDVLDYTPDGRAQIKVWRGDPKMWDRKHESTETIADEYIYHAKLRGMKMPLSPGNNDVALGVSTVDWMFRKGVMSISPKCVNTYQEHAGLEQSENEKIKELQRDHLVTGTRYAVSAFPREFEVSIKLTQCKSLVDIELENMLQKQQAGQGVYGL